MKTWIALLFCLFFVTTTNFAQKVTKNKYQHKVQTLDSTIETLYAVISGEAGEVRDWELF